MINPKGSNPTKKKIIPLAIILNVKPDRIESSKCPATIFAARRRPKDTALDRYEINSINTNKGNNPNGHPAGTKREKNLAP